MAIGIIEQVDPSGFNLVKAKMFKRWDEFNGVNSFKRYQSSGLSFNFFLWDTFYATRVKIGDGVGTSGDVKWYAVCNDTHITTALKKMWELYLSSKGGV